MERVGVRELKNRLSEYLRRVGLGESFLVTEHGRPVAEIKRPSPVPPGFESCNLAPSFWERVERGEIELARQANLPELYQELPAVVMPEGTAQRILDESRAE